MTAHLPYGGNEPFVVPEILELGRLGWHVAVVPVRGRGAVVHREVTELVPAGGRPLFSLPIARAALAELVSSPGAVVRVVRLLRGSRGARILAKNLAVVPKGLWLARHVRRARVAHIHAHWASTTATLGMLASEISGVSWSFTAHRWDIGENNLLPVKARHACFVRAISEHGAAELRTHVLDSTWSPVVLHMGVGLPPPRAPGVPAGPSLRVLPAARFVEKKGHVHLLDALSLLLELGVAVRVELAGDGPLEPMLRRRVQELGLDRNVVFRGKVSHERLLRELAEGRWDASVLPSVVTASGELEGIPVSLIEAMASGVPAVGTASGGMPELLEGGAGILVPPGDPEALADALAALAADPAQRAALARKGRERVEDAFSVESVAAALAGRFRDCASGPTASRPAP